jgi:adenylate cyclase, class 2
MNDTDRELEVKFYLTKRKELEERLIAQGGQLKEPRVHEINLRFDTPDQSLLNTGRLLRLRLDSRARVTYKGLGSIEGGARLRQELEFTVSNFDTARALFEALGYEVYMMYEKFRTSYKLGNLEVVLDEMPYGDFAEIEGPDGQSIQTATQQLEINWDARIMDSYTVLFEVARAKMGLDFRDLSFENFKGLLVTPEVLGVLVADQS